MRRASPYAGLADEGGIVLLPPAEDLYHPADLALPADHRVQGPGGGQPGQIPGVLLQQSRTSPLCLPLLSPACPRLLEGGEGRAGQSGGELSELSAVEDQGTGGGAPGLMQDPQEQVAGAHPGLPLTERGPGGQSHDPAAAGGEPLEGPLLRRARAGQPHHGLGESGGIQSGLSQDTARRASGDLRQSQQQVLGADIGVPQPGRRFSGFFQGFLGVSGELSLFDGASLLSPRSRGWRSRSPWAALWEAPSSSGVSAPAISMSHLLSRPRMVSTSSAIHCYSIHNIKL